MENSDEGSAPTSVLEPTKQSKSYLFYLKLVPFPEISQWENRSSFGHILS